MVFEVDNMMFVSVIEGLKVLKMCGMGVFMLNKQFVCEYVDELMLVVKLVGVINIIVNDDGYLCGYNMDGMGYIWVIKESGFDIWGKIMVLFGVGGVVIVIGVQVVIEGIKEIKLFNCKDDFFEKVVVFVKWVNENIDCVVIVIDFVDQYVFIEVFVSVDILMNGIKVGMKLLENEFLIGDVFLFCFELLVIECVYNLYMIKLLQQV